MNQNKRRNKKNKKSSEQEVEDSNNDLQIENTSEGVQDSPDSQSESAPVKRDSQTNIKDENFENQLHENSDKNDNNENFHQNVEEIQETKVTESEEIKPEPENKVEFQEKQEIKNLEEEKNEKPSEKTINEIKPASSHNVQEVEQIQKVENVEQPQTKQPEKKESALKIQEEEINKDIKKEDLEKKEEPKPIQPIPVQQNQEDKSSDKSQSGSSLNDFFTFSRQYNAMRIQSQIAQMQVNAVEYAKSLIQLGRRFNTIIRRLNNSSVNFFNTLFSVMGYTYKPTSNAANLFVFTTQAWLIDLSQLLDVKIKSYNSEALENFKFSDIVKLIKENETKLGVTPERELKFLNNLGVLTGNLLIERQHSSSFTLIENNIGKNFLHSMSGVIQNSLEPIEEEVDKRRFEEILFHLFKKGVERTLNFEMQSETFTEFYVIYESMKKEHERRDSMDSIDREMKLRDGEKELHHTISIPFESYSNKVRDFYSEKLNKNLNAFEINELKICSETFYEFAQLSLDDILNDISLFIKNYSSILFKVKRFLSQSLNKYKKISNQLISKAEGVYHTVEEKINLIPGKEKLITLFLFSEGVFLDKFNSGKVTLLKNVARMVKKGTCSVNSLKMWVDESFDHMKHLNILKINLPYVAKITSMISTGINLGLLQTRTIYKFSVSKLEVGYERYTNIRNNILHLAKTMFNKTLVCAEDGIKFFSINKIIKVEEKEDRMDILINKEIMLINPEKFFGIYHLINDTIQNGMKRVGELTNKGNEVKNYVIMNLYKKFLSSEKSEEKEKNIKGNIEMAKLGNDSKQELKEVKEIQATA
jgi:hypothetical protein